MRGGGVLRAREQGVCITAAVTRRWARGAWLTRLGVHVTYSRRYVLVHVFGGVFHSFPHEALLLYYCSVLKHMLFCRTIDAVLQSSVLLLYCRSFGCPTVLLLHAWVGVNRQTAFLSPGREKPMKTHGCNLEKPRCIAQQNAFVRGATDCCVLCAFK